MKISLSRFPKLPWFLVLFILCVLGVPSTWAQSPQVIPLSFQNVSGQDRLVIYAGINGSAALPYLFDTGSAIFNAAYYNGPYTGPGTNPTAWTYSSTLSTGATYGYSNFHYTLNAVTVQTIEIYAAPTDVSPTLVLSATSINPSSVGFTIGQVTNTSMTYSHGASFESNLAQGIAPFTNATNSPFYGTFGAGIFSTTNSSGSASFVTGSVLGQSTTTGWAVVATESTPYAILGLDEGIRTQFSSSTDWSGTGNSFPNSGTTSGTEFGAGSFSMTLSGTGAPIHWTNTGILLDTGTANNMFNATGVDAGELDRYYADVDADVIAAGNQIEMVGLSPGPGSYSFTTTNAANPVTYNVTMEGTTAPHSTVGINFFLNNSVAFDFENRKTFYTPSTVVVPEPSTATLILLAASLGFFSRKKARCTKP